MMLDGRVAIVTGSASGLGHAFALGLAGEGARVVIADANLAGARTVADAIAAAGGEALAVAVDVRDRAQVDQTLARAVERFGQVDILINSAGVDQRIAFLEMSEEQWDRVIDINLKGTFLCCQAAVRHMRPRRAGKIVNVASSRGLYGQPFGTHYSASKGGVVSFTRSLAMEVAEYGINVNAIMPGRTDTPMARQHRPPEEFEALRRAGQVGQPTDMVGTILFLVSDLGAQITGEVIKRDIRIPGPPLAASQEG